MWKLSILWWATHWVNSVTLIGLLLDSLPPKLKLACAALWIRPQFPEKLDFWRSAEESIKRRAGGSSATGWQPSSGVASSSDSFQGWQGIEKRTTIKSNFLLVGTLLPGQTRPTTKGLFHSSCSLTRTSPPRPPSRMFSPISGSQTLAMLRTGSPPDSWTPQTGIAGWSLSQYFNVFQIQICF